MNRSLVIHVGSAKTGTSEIQSALVAVQDELAERSVSYPNLTGEGFGSGAERGLTSGNGAINKPTGDPVVDEAVWQRLLDHLGDAPQAELQIVSSELLLALAVEEFFWRALAGHAAATGREAVVVVYLRDPFSFVLSTYAQSVKITGYSASLEDWADSLHAGQHYDVFLKYPNLDRMVEFAGQYGCQLKVFRYEDAGRAIVEHFLGTACEVNVANLTIPQRNFNKSLTAFDCSFHRGVNSRRTKLGNLLGWERTDPTTASSQLSSGEPGRFELSSAGEAKLTELFVTYRSMLARCTDFADRVDYSIDRRQLTEHYTTEEAGIHLKFFELGQIVASSYQHGYVRWDFDNAKKKD